MGNKSNSNIILYIFIGIIIISSIISCVDKELASDTIDNVLYGDTFNIIASTSTKQLDKYIIDYGKEKGINVEIEHYGDLEIVDILNQNSANYDAVWISNSTWLYMLDN